MRFTLLGVNCTDNAPPANSSALEIDVSFVDPGNGSDDDEWGIFPNPTTGENDLIILPYQSTLTYACSTFGKAFYDDILDVFQSVFVVTCQHDKTWNYVDHIYDCEWNRCLNPPNPPAASVLLLSGFDPADPPYIDDQITYICNTTGHNKFRYDYSSDQLRLPCEWGNTVTAPATWPTCMPDIVCPFPASTAEISPNETDTSKVFNYNDVISYSCIDKRYKIKELSWVDSLAEETLEANCRWNEEEWSYTPDVLACARKQSTCILIKIMYLFFLTQSRGAFRFRFLLQLL